MSLHRETFTALVQHSGWTVGAELGVDKGILFGMLLRACPSLTLLGVDTFPDAQRSKRVPDLVAAYAPRARVLKMSTGEASVHVPDRSLDFVFIDADHSYAFVRDDIAAWKPKVRKGGWIGGHDFNEKFPGVMNAAREAFHAKTIDLWPGSIWGVWC